MIPGLRIESLRSLTMKLSLLIRRVTNQIKLTVYTTFPRNHSPTITPSLKGASESPTKQHEIVLKVADRNHFLWKQIGFLFFFLLLRSEVASVKTHRVLAWNREDKTAARNGTQTQRSTSRIPTKTQQLDRFAARKKNHEQKPQFLTAKTLAQFQAKADLNSLSFAVTSSKRKPLSYTKPKDSWISLMQWLYEHLPVHLTLTRTFCCY